MKSMINGIEWASLDSPHIYKDFAPEYLRGLYSRTDGNWRDTNDRLISRLASIGPDEISVNVIPFIFDLLSQRPEYSDALLYDLAHIIFGLSSDWLPKPIEIEKFGHWMSRCYELVESRVIELSRYLDEDDAKVQIASLYLLSWFPRLSNFNDILLERLKLDSSNVYLRVNELLSYSNFCIHSRQSPEFSVVLRELSQENTLLQVAAAIAIGPWEMNEVREILVEASLLEDFSFFEEFPFMEGDLAFYAEQVLDIYG